jgi:hypothetical protein
MLRVKKENITFSFVRRMKKKNVERTDPVEEKSPT